MNLKFNSIENYKKFLKSKLDLISRNGEYVIYLHHIDVFFGKDVIKYKTENKLQIARLKADSIMKNGLMLDNDSFCGIPYTTINATASYICETGKLTDENLEKIISYVFCSSKNDDRVVVLLAIPKHIKYNDKEIEFCSYKGVHNCTELRSNVDKNIQKELENNTNIRHSKFGLVDCILTNNIIPKEYVLGTQFILPSIGKVLYSENISHLSNLTSFDYLNFNNERNKKIKEFGLDDNCSNIYELIAKKNKEDFEYYSRREMEEF